jgi:Pyruvate/2-oxoacid:ferredoxin oxidoreductase delta subunit
MVYYYVPATSEPPAITQQRSVPKSPSPPPNHARDPGPRANYSSILCRTCLVYCPNSPIMYVRSWQSVVRKKWLPSFIGTEIVVTVSIGLSVGCPISRRCDARARDSADRCRTPTSTHRVRDGAPSLRPAFDGLVIE